MERFCNFRWLFVLYFYLIILELKAQKPAVDRSDAISYVSLNEAVKQGQYDGYLSVGELKKSGDFGLGSTDKLTYEIAMADGHPFGISADGKAVRLNDTIKIAFASAKFFKVDLKTSIRGLKDLKSLEKHLDSLLLKNMFAAVKVTGKFTFIEYRCFKTQSKPYVPNERASNVKFRRENIYGTMIGFFTPSTANAINDPVYHFHFIAEDRSTGGHVMEVQIDHGIIEADFTQELHILLPDSKMLKEIDLNK